MMFDRHEVQHVAITLADGSVAVMQFVTRAVNTKRQTLAQSRKATVQSFIDSAPVDPLGVAGVEERLVALRAELTALDAVIEGYVREATDEAIQAEIDKSAFAQPIVSWRRITSNDLPKSRENRDAWRDDGKVIAVDPVCIKPRTPTVEARLVALEAIVARLDGVSSESKGET